MSIADIIVVALIGIAIIAALIVSAAERKKAVFVQAAVLHAVTGIIVSIDKNSYAVVFCIGIFCIYSLFTK